MDQVDRRGYMLATHVHVSRTREHLVFLDLKRDRYLGVSLTDAEALGRRISGLASLVAMSGTAGPAPPGTPPVLEAKALQTLDEMVQLGMLVDASEACVSRTAAAIARPEKALTNGYVDVARYISVSDLVVFVYSALSTYALLRWRSLDQIVARIHRQQRVRPNSEFDIDRIRSRVAVFNRLRPLFYTERNACLFSTLAIRQFLSRERFLPQVVFGVATTPFKAHCWLQHEDIVINDIPEYVREYTPILVV
jgi:hypothetical protein